MRRIYFISLIILTIAIIGCSARIGDFTIMSTKNVDIGGKYVKLSRTEGSDTTPYILFFPIGAPNLEQAVDDCLENVNGDLLTNIVIDASDWWAILYGERTITVIGDAWQKASMSDLNDSSLEIYELVSNENGLQLISVNDHSKVVSVEYFPTY